MSNLLPSFKRFVSECRYLDDCEELLHARRHKTPSAYAHYHRRVLPLLRLDMMMFRFKGKHNEHLLKRAERHVLHAHRTIQRCVPNKRTLERQVWELHGQGLLDDQEDVGGYDYAYGSEGDEEYVDNEGWELEFEVDSSSSSSSSSSIEE